MTARLGFAQCSRGCVEIVEFGLICSNTPDVESTEDDPLMHPSDSPCIDGVMHRTETEGWHTCNGTTPERWWADCGNWRMNYGGQAQSVPTLFDLTGGAA